MCRSVSPASVIVSMREDVALRHHTRIWVESPNRSATELNCRTTGKARPPDDSAYPEYGADCEWMIRESS